VQARGWRAGQGALARSTFSTSSRRSRRQRGRRWVRPHRHLAGQNLGAHERGREGRAGQALRRGGVPVPLEPQDEHARRRRFPEHAGQGGREERHDRRTDPRCFLRGVKGDRQAGAPQASGRPFAPEHEHRGGSRRRKLVGRAVKPIPAACSITEVSSLGQLPARDRATPVLTLGRRARPEPDRQSSPTCSRPPAYPLRSSSPQYTASSPWQL